MSLASLDGVRLAEETRATRDPSSSSSWPMASGAETRPMNDPKASSGIDQTSTSMPPPTLSRERTKPGLGRLGARDGEEPVVEAPSRVVLTSEPRHAR